jgi:hypothetical protein
MISRLLGPWPYVSDDALCVLDQLLPKPEAGWPGRAPSTESEALLWANATGGAPSHGFARFLLGVRLELEQEKLDRRRREVAAKLSRAREIDRSRERDRWAQREKVKRERRRDRDRLRAESDAGAPPRQFSVVSWPRLTSAGDRLTAEKRSGELEWRAIERLWRVAPDHRDGWDRVLPLDQVIR